MMEFSRYDQPRRRRRTKTSRVASSLSLLHFIQLWIVTQEVLLCRVQLTSINLFLTKYKAFLNRRNKMHFQEISAGEESESDTSRGQRENPLLNSLVLIKIFIHLGIEDLKSCRLVCWDWHNASLLGLRKSVKIYVDNENAVEEFEDLTGLHEVGNFRLNMCRDGGNMLLTKFLDSPSIVAVRELTITCLNVTYAILAFLSYLPQLENLTLAGPRKQKGYPKCITPKTKFCKERNPGQMFLKLKRLVCLDMPIVQRGTITQVLMASPNLTEIVTNVPAIDNFVWRTVGFWRTSLVSLEIGYIHTLYSSFEDSSTPVPLCKLKQLRCNGGNVRCPDSTRAPNLETAVFDYPNMDILFPDDLNNTTLKTLRIENPYIAQWAGFTSERFPFLKILNFLWMTHALFRMVCKNLKTIEELHVGPEILDSSITGLPRYKPRTWQALIEAVKNKRKFTVANYRKYACVADLPGLKRISITGNCRLTEACILLGLAHCKSLESIVLDKIPEVSMVTIRIIANKLPGLRIFNLYSYNLRDDESSAAMAYLNKKLPNCIVQF